MIKFEIPGEPIPKARPRFTKKGIAYDVQDGLKKKFIWKIKSACKDSSYSCPIKSPLQAEITFYLKIPQKKNRNLSLWHLESPDSKPDLDNLAKWILDCMNEIFYEDDRQIISLKLNKFYSDNPRTEIHLMPKSIELPEKAKKILAMIEPQELVSIGHDISMVANFISKAQLNPDKNKETALFDAAYLISKFADNHAAILYKISKKYPGTWKELIVFNPTVSMEGKTLC